jgi:TPP-dependent pyruvate/acetoin dehydrogenase alpha subunit
MQYIDEDEDYITGTHRCHGQVLAYTGNPYRLACEMMGKKDGFNCGMGGSQHIKTGHYITNGVTGGMAAVGCGMALSLKRNHHSGIVISFLGDGGFQEGYFQETMNMAQTYQVPILYILENNQYAMSTRTRDYSSGAVEDRVEASGMKYFYADAREVEELDKNIRQAYLYVKENKEPAFVEVNTFRLCGHSKSDERAYMTENEKQKNIEDDPLVSLRKMLPEDTLQVIEDKAANIVQDAFAQAGASGELKLDEYQKEKKNGTVFA